MARRPEGGLEVDEEEGGGGGGEQEESGMVGGGVVAFFDEVEEGDGEGAGVAGDVAAEHEDDAELADGVGKGEEGGGEQGALAERESEGAEDAPRAGAQAGGGFGVAPVDAGEAGDERLDGEGQAVDEGSGDEAGEAKGEGVAEEAREKAAGCGERAEADEEVEAEDGGWEDEREGDQSLDQGAGQAFAARQPPSDGDR